MIGGFAVADLAALAERSAKTFSQSTNKEMQVQRTLQATELDTHQALVDEQLWSLQVR